MASVMDVNASTIRGGITAPPGKKLVVCDLSSIESRVLGWLSCCTRINTIFREGRDTYKDFASHWFGIPYEQVTKEQRTLSKPPDLGCGYQLSGGTLVEYAANMGIQMSGKDAKEAVRLWRQLNWEVPKMWEWLVEAGKWCIHSPGGEAAGYGVVLKSDERFLTITLPSTRKLYYHLPTIEWRTVTVLDPETGEDRTFETESICYMGMHQKTHQWSRLSTHGGKLTENCLAEGTLVLTHRGWIPIEQVKNTDLVHDGEGFQKHGGKIFKSVQECVNIDGVFMTPDHEVLTNEGWEAASEDPKPYRPNLRYFDLFRARTFGWKKKTLALFMRMREQSNQSRCRRQERNKTRWETKLRVSDSSINWRREYKAWHDTAPGLLGLALNDRSMPTTNSSSLEELRSTWNHRVQRMGRIFRGLLGGYGTYLPVGSDLGTYGQQRELFPTELSMEDSQTSGQQQKRECFSGNRSWGNDRITSGSGFRHKENHTSLSVSSRTSHRVFDILNCGSRHRFVVKGNNGPFIVHNCVQATARDILACGMVPSEQDPLLEVVGHVHDEIICLADEANAETALERLSDYMSRVPDWAPGLLLGANGYVAERYRKE